MMYIVIAFKWKGVFVAWSPVLFVMWQIICPKAKFYLTYHPHTYIHKKTIKHLVDPKWVAKFPTFILRHLCLHESYPFACENFRTWGVDFTASFVPHSSVFTIPTHVHIWTCMCICCCEFLETLQTVCLCVAAHWTLVISFFAPLCSTRMNFDRRLYVWYIWSWLLWLLLLLLLLLCRSCHFMPHLHAVRTH